MTQQHVTADRHRRAPVDVGDLVLGALSVVGGLAVVIYANGMPTVGGLPGPGLFPMIIGWFFVVLGAGLVLQTLLAARRGGAAPEAGGTAPSGAEERAVVDHGTGEEAAAAVEAPAAGSTAAPASTEQGGHWSNAAVVLGGIVFYVLAAEFLGFPLTMFLVLAAIMLVLRSRVVVALLTAAGITAGLYAVFELLLLVQLPDGFLG